MAEESLAVLAKISSNVYYIGDVAKMNAGCPYQVIPASINDDVGLCAMAVYEKGRNRVLAIKGTSLRGTDIGQDISMVLGGTGSYTLVQPTLDLGRRLISQYNVNLITGHSLGGYIAEILATTVRIAGASFCGPGVNGPVIKLGGKETSGFQNIQYEHDALGNFNCAVYQHVQWSVYCDMSGHSIDGMVEYFKARPGVTNRNVVSRSSSHMTGYYYPN
mmetsp:Transcript_25061/g.36972  ORF Transcript_25061/g.36972 Transcript_25061/m.36972 type:complete len:218 (+) Transcript_25061:90-743(+)|eukprot:CAMPEP_0185024628 /NCGR_PEP_ID=MMETSP1103-20130426/7788_1 /TAXON_ID=36769 /ORGANISM="Paraphysomonas bandaiensis, Strain Caron Lab Isolate" /LENGTH=217 /DNA_ID=CAMNT_0027557645 /DNA_START=89 /DNA_END=742 /DNA_ORIENTATION=+